MSFNKIGAGFGFPNEKSTVSDCPTATFTCKLDAVNSVVCPPSVRNNDGPATAVARSTAVNVFTVSPAL